MFTRNYDAVEFGKRMRTARKNVGMTQEQLADQLILSVDSVSRIENGKVMCMPEHLVHICEVLNVTSDYLYFGDTLQGQGTNKTLSSINAMLADCEADELCRLEQMMKLFLNR